MQTSALVALGFAVLIVLFGAYNVLRRLMMSKEERAGANASESLLKGLVGMLLWMGLGLALLLFVFSDMAESGGGMDGLKETFDYYMEQRKQPMEEPPAE